MTITFGMFDPPHRLHPLVLQKSLQLMRKRGPGSYQLKVEPTNGRKELGNWGYFTGVRYFRPFISGSVAHLVPEGALI